MTALVTGSSPVVGSSYRMYFGRSAIARAMPTRLRIPPDSSAGKRFCDVRQIDEIERFADALGDLAFGELLLFSQSHRDVLADGERVEERGELEDVADASAQFVELAPRQRRAPRGRRR